MPLTISALIAAYRTDKQSSHSKLSYRVRLDRDRYLARLQRDYGHYAVGLLNGRILFHWYRKWSRDGKVAVGNALIGQLRAASKYGMLYLEDPDCERLVLLLDKMVLSSVVPRNTRMSAAHVDAIRSKAREIGYFSIALAQAFQYEALLPQRDVIGEWLPKAEATEPIKVERGGYAWVGGLCWEEIDEDFVLRHRTSTREGWVAIDLKKQPMVFEELHNTLWSYKQPRPLLRSHLPQSGPVVVYEASAFPWKAVAFRTIWRKIADIVGVPADVKNKDSRAGAKITRIAGRHFRDFERERPGQMSRSSELR